MSTFNMPLDPENPQLKKGGRPGYEFEQAQLEKMRNILNRDLKLTEKLHDKIDKGEELSGQEEKLMQLTSTRINKIYDKLHASKTDVTSDGKQITINIAKEIAEANNIEKTT